MTEDVLPQDEGLLFPRHQKKKGTAASRRRRPDIVKKYKDSHPMCEIKGCGVRGYKGPHHIKFLSQGGEDKEENLIRVCSHHHDLCHGVYPDLWFKICMGVKKGFGNG